MLHGPPSVSVATIEAPTVQHSAPEALRLGVVSFLNALPLVDGLENLRGLVQRPSVPSLLIDLLLEGEVDAALCSAIDYQRSPEPLVALPVGALGSRGTTRTVALYSRVAPEAISEVHCDTDSHTSVALLSIVLHERFGTSPRLVPFNAREHTVDHRVVPEPEAMLLIGDKVVSNAPDPQRYPHVLDLGAEWFSATGRPFVFAFWMARADTDAWRLRTLAAILDRQRRFNRERLDGIVQRHAAVRAWPRELAARYVKEYLRFEFDDEAQEGYRLFCGKAVECGLLQRVRELRLVDQGA